MRRPPVSMKSRETLVTRSMYSDRAVPVFTSPLSIRNVERILCSHIGARFQRPNKGFAFEICVHCPYRKQYSRVIVNIRKIVYGAPAGI